MRWFGVFLLAWILSGELLAIKIAIQKQIVTPGAFVFANATLGGLITLGVWLIFAGS